MAARQTAKGNARPTKRSGATTRKRAAKPPRAAIPGWLWGIAGLVAGFFLAQYVQRSAPEPLARVLSKPSAEATAESPRGASGATSEDEPRMPTFEFYTLLPESEVIAPRAETQAAAEAPKPPAPAPEPAADETPEDPIAAQLARQQQAPSGEAGSDRRYVLQAASFREPGDAQRLAGRLQDFGLLAQISEVQTGDGATWHRVQVGPYDNTGELNRAQDLMITQGIEPLMIRLQN